MLKKIVGSICLIMVMFALVGCDSLAGLGFGSFGDDTCFNGFGKDFFDKELRYIVLKNMLDSFLGDFGIE